MTALEFERKVEADRRAGVAYRNPTRKQSALRIRVGVPLHASSRKERRSRKLQAKMRDALPRDRRHTYTVPPPGRPLTNLEYARLTANATYEELCRLL